MQINVRLNILPNHEMNTSSARTTFALLFCGSLVLALAMGVRFTAGIFLQPMTLTNGWGREVFSFAIALQNIVWGLASPVAGAIADRYGPGRTLAGGAMAYVAGLLLMSHADTPLALDLSTGLLIGIGMAGTSYAVVMGVVSRHTAPEKRSMALGIVGAGGSFGQFAVLPAGQAMIGSLGWQTALLGLAAGVALIVPLAATLAERGGGRSPQGGHSIAAALKSAGRSRSFHLLFWSYFVCGFQTAFILLHMPAFVVDAGFSANVGMAAVALIGLFNIFGTLLFGWCGGRWRFKQLLTVIYGVRALVILPLLLFPLSEAGVYLFAAAMGLLWLATVPLTNALVGKVFGLRHMSMLSGLVFLGHQLGSFLGAWAGGAIFDRTGSYSLAWTMAVGLSLAAALLCLPIEEKPQLRVATT